MRHLEAGAERGERITGQRRVEVVGVGQGGGQIVARARRVGHEAEVAAVVVGVPAVAQA